MYCSFSNYFGPNKFGDHFVLNCVLGALEIYWMLVFQILKKWCINENWRQAIGWSMNSYPLHPTNYISVTSISFSCSHILISTGCLIAWIHVFVIVVILAMVLIELSIVNVYKFRWVHIVGTIQNHAYDPPIPNMSI